MKSIVISCGGTGGHLAPGIALAEGLLAKATAASVQVGVTLLISQKKIDARLSESYPQLRFVPVPGVGFSWAPLRFLRCVGSQLQGLFFCLNLLLREKPCVVLGMGGFTSAGVALAARLLGIPLALHESNRVPGLATRLLGRLAARVYLPVGVRLPALRLTRIRHVGLPVRREIVPQPRSAARERLGLDPKRPVLVVFGGSQGAGPLNDWVEAQLTALAAEGVQVYCVTGPGKGEPRRLELPVKTKTRAPKTTEASAEAAADLRSAPPSTSEAQPIEQPATPTSDQRVARQEKTASLTGLQREARQMKQSATAVFVPFCDDVATLLSAATLVVSRAGAGTIAELIRCAAPAILVPYPHAADDHQRANAAFFEKQGGGIVVEQSEIGRLTREVRDTIFNDWLLHRLRNNLRLMEGRPAVDFILDDLETLTRG